MGGRSLLKFDVVPGVIVGVKFVLTVLEMAGGRAGHLGERSDRSAVDGRNVAVVDVTCRGEGTLRRRDSLFGLYVEPVCPNFFDDSVSGATVGDEGLGPPKAIGRSRLLLDVVSLMAGRRGASSVPGACERRKPICTVAVETIEERLFPKPNWIFGGGARLVMSYMLATGAAGRVVNLFSFVGNNE